MEGIVRSKCLSCLLPLSATHRCICLLRFTFTFPPAQWDNLPDLTAPPYHLTLKSNGCLILIAALTPDTLLVTSKHAVGQSKSGETAMASDKGKEVAAESEDSQANGGLVDDNGQRITSHALVGELWLDRGLRRVGLTRKDLAQRLWNENWTLVAEVS